MIGSQTISGGGSQKSPGEIAIPAISFKTPSGSLSPGYGGNRAHHRYVFLKRILDSIRVITKDVFSDQRPQERSARSARGGREGWIRAVPSTPPLRLPRARHPLSKDIRVETVRLRYQRKSHFAPGIEPALEGSNPLDASPSQKQRRPGAGGLIGSSTVEDDVSIGRDLRS